MIWLILSVILYFFLYRKYLKRTSINYLVWFTIMYIYLYLVLWVTILPIDFTLDLKYKYSIQFTYLNVIPFIDLLNKRPLALREIILNIVMTIPFGFLYSKLFKSTSVFKTIKATFLLSLLIESTQLLMTCFLLHYRICDITDLITNTMGGIIGYYVYVMVKDV